MALTKITFSKKQSPRALEKHDIEALWKIYATKRWGIKKIPVYVSTFRNGIITLGTSSAAWYTECVWLLFVLEREFCEDGIGQRGNSLRLRFRAMSR